MKRILLFILIIMLVVLIALPAHAAKVSISAPEDLKAEYYDHEEIKISWDKVKNANRYAVYRRRSDQTEWTKIATVKTTSYIDDEATYKKTFYYQVRPYYYKKGASNVWGAYDETGVKITSRMPAPANFSAKFTQVETVKLEWDAVKYANRYAVYRREKGETEWTRIGTSKTTTYTDTEATDSKVFVYRIRPYNYKSGRTTRYGLYSKTSGNVDSRIRRPDITSLKSVGYGTVDIAWKDSRGSEKYLVMRKRADESEWSVIAEGIKGTKYRDNTAKNGETYDYTVRGTATRGDKTFVGFYSKTGQEVTVEFNAPTNLSAANTAYNEITLAWDSMENVSGYYIYRRTSDSEAWEQIASTSKATYTDAVTTGQTYCYTVAGYAETDEETVVGRTAEAVEKTAKLAAPSMTELPKEAVVVDLKWSKVEDADGYRVYRKTGTSSWKRIAELNKTQYRDADAEFDTKYQYRVRAYKTLDDGRVYSDYCASEEIKRISHVHFHQGDDAWGFSRSLEKNACVLSCVSMMFKNLGEDTNPKYVYKANGNDDGMEFDKALKYYDRKYACALSASSKYYDGYYAKMGWTYVKNPEKNAVAAIKEALDRNPEGVMCYFVKGSSRMHGILAIGYKGDTIYYSDPGRVRSKGHNVTFSNTWCKKGHNMSYKHLKFIMAID